MVSLLVPKRWARQLLPESERRAHRRPCSGGRASRRTSAYQSASVGWSFGVYSVAAAVDGYVMVVPTQGGEIGGMVGAAVGEPFDVVGLEAVSAVTAVDDTSTVAVGNAFGVPRELLPNSVPSFRGQCVR